MSEDIIKIIIESVNNHNSYNVSIDRGNDSSCYPHQTIEGAIDSVKSSLSVYEREASKKYKSIYCEWNNPHVMDYVFYNTQCDRSFKPSLPNIEQLKYCPYCGKKIKEKQND